MKLDISLVPHGMIHGVLPQIIPHLGISSKWSKGRVSADDILKFIFTGQMQLWVVLDQTKIYGHIVTEVKQYPGKKMFAVQYCSIEPHHLEQVEDKMQELAEKFAKDAGCSGIEFTGRPGWSKSMKKYGYDVQSVVFQKFFE